MNRGKLLILLMIAAGVAAGALKVWQQHRHMDQVLASLSPRVVRLIAEAPQSELLRLRPASAATNLPAEGTLEIERRVYQIVDRKNVVAAKGFVDVRDRLVDDASYEWNLQLEPGPGEWQYMLLFADGPQQARLAFELRGERSAAVKLLDGGPTVSADPIADGLATFFAAQFDEVGAPEK